MTSYGFVASILTILAAFFALIAILSPESLGNALNGFASWISGGIDDNKEKILSLIRDWWWIILSIPVWIVGDFIGLALSDRRSGKYRR